MNPRMQLTSFLTAVLGQNPVVHYHHDRGRGLVVIGNKGWMGDKFEDCWFDAMDSAAITALEALKSMTKEEIELLCGLPATNVIVD